MNNFSQRKYIIGAIIVLISLTYVLRLFALQVLDSSYKNSADNNSRRYVTEYPARGLIYDRNGELLVYNEAAYDLMIIPRQIEIFDTLDFCSILNIEKKQLEEYIYAAKKYSYYKPSIFISQLSATTYAVLQEKLYKFHGFFVQTRTLRKYPQGIAAHVLGYVGEVDKSITNNDKYYNPGDYVGISGVEKTYEKELRGEKGISIFLVDVHNRIKGSFKDGEYDELPVVGADIVSTLDADLQKYGEILMQNKRGSIVAIEPSTGEILTLVTNPAYDPNLLVGRVRTKNYRALARDTLKPLFNRAIMAKYPPGSTFKLLNALIGLQEGILTTKTKFSCHYGYTVGRFHLGCHSHRSPLNLIESVQHSCNAYYCHTFRNILDDPKFESVGASFDNWRKHITSFGLGSVLGCGFNNELSGFVPSRSYYDRYYGKDRWKSLTVVSLAIGQGEMGVTPLQMANMSATLANRGHYFVPHIVKSIKGQKSIDKRFLEKHHTTIEPKYFEPIIDGMELVVHGGAGSTARIAKVEGLTICGKTGTAENPHGKDHSIFIAFAPKDDPKIAIAVYIENGGFGSTWAAPIASLMIEKYVNDTISRGYLEKHILNGNLLNN